MWNSKIAVGFGSNVGDRLGNIRRALRMVSTLDVRDVKTSDVYETPPWGNESQHRFLNACAVFEAAFEPFAFLQQLKTIERKIGRVEREHWGPREIDVDILLWGDLRLQTPTLSIPHPHMHRRTFVLVPLAQISGDMRHPLLEETVSDLLSKLNVEERNDVLRVIGV